MLKGGLSESRQKKKVWAVVAHSQLRVCDDLGMRLSN